MTTKILVAVGLVVFLVVLIASLVFTICKKGKNTNNAVAASPVITPVSYLNEEKKTEGLEADSKPHIEDEESQRYGTADPERSQDKFVN